MVFLFNFEFVIKNYILDNQMNFLIFNACNNLFEMSSFKEGEEFSTAFEVFFDKIKAELNKMLSGNKDKILK